MRFFRFAPVLALLFVTTAAHAVPKSPVSIANQLGLDYQPPCSVCHTSKGVPNSGDVNTPFARAMLDGGLVPNNRPALNAALATLTAARTDSDADGLSDIAELRLGLDPNLVDALPTTTSSAALVDDHEPPVGTSCGISRGAPRGSDTAAAWAAVIALVVRAHRARRGRAAANELRWD